MQTATYEQITEGLDQTLDFCAGLGLAEEVAGSRFKRYREHVERLLMEVISKPRPSPVSEQIDADSLPYLIALIEATEFAQKNYRGSVPNFKDLARRSIAAK